MGCLKIPSMSHNRAKELDYFCRQYWEKKEKLQDVRNPLKAQNLTGMPKGETSSTTEFAALIAMTISEDIKAIEQSAMAVTPNHKRLLLYVTGKIKGHGNLIVAAQIKEFYKNLDKRLLTRTLSSGKMSTMV